GGICPRDCGFTCSVDVCQKNLIRVVESLRELVKQTFGSRKSMRLKSDSHLAWIGTASGGQSCADLSGMVAIIVHQGDTVRFIHDRETTSHPMKRLQSFPQNIERYFELVRHSNRSKSIENIVLTRETDAEFSQVLTIAKRPKMGHYTLDANISR